MYQDMTVLAIHPVAMAYNTQKEKNKKTKDDRKMRDKRKSGQSYADVQAYYIHAESPVTHYPTYGKDYLIR